MFDIILYQCVQILNYIFNHVLIIQNAKSQI